MLEFPALEREGRRTLGIFCSLEGERTRSSKRAPLPKVGSPLRDDVKQRRSRAINHFHTHQGDQIQKSLWIPGVMEKRDLSSQPCRCPFSTGGGPGKGQLLRDFCCPHAVVCPQGSQQGTLPCCCLAEGGDSSCCWLQLWHGPVPTGNRSPHPCLGSPT